MLRSRQGPVLTAIDHHDPSSEPDGARDRVDGSDHHLVWPDRRSAQVRAPRFSALVTEPFGVWVPASVPYSITASGPVWVARFAAHTCPEAWHRHAQFALSDVVAPILVGIGRYPSRPWASELVSAVVDHLHDALTTNPAPLPLPSDPRARAVAEALDADPAHPWELRDWAVDVGIGERTLRRIFVNETGLPFASWRRQLRVQRALRLLRDGLAVAEVSARSPDAFARAFRATTGRLPSEIAGADQRPGLAADLPRPLRAEPWPRRSDDLQYDVYRRARHLEGDLMNTPARRLVLPLLALALLAAACGDADGADSSAATASSAGGSEPTDATEGTGAPDEATTVDFTDGVGRTVEVPAEPRRIVAIDLYGSADPLLSVGAPVVGVPVWDGIYGDVVLHYEGGGDIPKVGKPWELDVEAILALEPDLIVGDGWGGEVNLHEPDVIPQLEAIAPTVFLDTSLSVDEHMATIGELVGRSDVVDEQRALAEAAIDELAGEVPDGWSATYVEWFDPSLWVYPITTRVTSRDVLRQIGVDGPPAVEEADDAIELSSERLLDSSADVLFYNPDAPPTALALFGELAAVESGQVYELPASLDANSYASRLRYVEFYRPILTGADPSIVDESAP